MMLFLHHPLKLPQLFFANKVPVAVLSSSKFALALGNQQGFQLLFHLVFNKILQALVVELHYRYEYILDPTYCVFTRHNSMLGFKLNSISWAMLA